MSYGLAERSSAELSACAAEFLAVHPYFDPDVPLENESPPTVELVSSTEYPFRSQSTPVQLRVRDDDGLHQVILFVRPKNPFLGSTPEVKACHGLSGETDTVVEFNFDGRLPSDNVGTSGLKRIRRFPTQFSIGSMSWPLIRHGNRYPHPEY